VIKVTLLFISYKFVKHFLAISSIDMTLPKLAIFTIGVYGEISNFLSNPTEISFLVT